MIKRDHRAFPLFHGSRQFGTPMGCLQYIFILFELIQGQAAPDISQPTQARAPMLRILSRQASLI
jgi:hypothetical protein